MKLLHSVNQSILICVALNHPKRRLKALCTIRERKTQLGPQSKQGVTVARKKPGAGQKSKVSCAVSEKN